MKTTQKVLSFITIATFIIFVAGMLAAGDCNYATYSDGPSDIQIFSNQMAAQAAILSFVLLIIWTIVFLRKVLLQKRNYLFYIYMIGLFPFFLTIFLLSIFTTILDYEYLSWASYTVYESIWWGLLSLVGSPGFWITLGLAEIIMVGIFLFRKYPDIISAEK